MGPLPKLKLPRRTSFTRHLRTTRPHPGASDRSIRHDKPLASLGCDSRALFAADSLLRSSPSADFQKSLETYFTLFPASVTSSQAPFVLLATQNKLDPRESSSKAQWA